MIQVMIVEDDPMLAELHRQFVEQVPGFCVSAVEHDGLQAVQTLKSIRIDLVVLDVYLPGMDGISLLKHMRKIGLLQEVILVTAARNASQVATAMKLGAVDYLIKPFEFSRMKQALGKAAQRHTLQGDVHEVSQDQIDILLQTHTEEEELPKGLHRQTLDRIKQTLQQSTRAMTAGDVADKLSLSKVSVRNYLNYLVDQKKAEIERDYSTGGRPSHQYRWIHPT